MFAPWQDNQSMCTSCWSGWSMSRSMTAMTQREQMQLTDPLMHLAQQAATPAPNAAVMHLASRCILKSHRSLQLHCMDIQHADPAGMSSTHNPARSTCIAGCKREYAVNHADLLSCCSIQILERSGPCLSSSMRRASQGEELDHGLSLPGCIMHMCVSQHHCPAVPSSPGMT